MIAAFVAIRLVNGYGNPQQWSVQDSALFTVLSFIDVSVIKPFTVVLDAGSGMAGLVAPRLFERLPCRVTKLCFAIDGTFPNHEANPLLEENRRDITEEVIRQRADIGIAWDGDADRLGVVDATGEIVWGDRLLALFARGILAKKQGEAVIADVKCSQALFDDVAKHGGRPVMWKTGHSLIKTKMKEEHAAVAGEMSGHFFFADRYFGYDDALYAALRLLEQLAGSGRTVLEELADLPRTFATPELRFDCPDALKTSVVERVRTALADRGEVNGLDGVRVRYADGAWSLVRASKRGAASVAFRTACPRSGC